MSVEGKLASEGIAKTAHRFWRGIVRGQLNMWLMTVG